jgi:hypothetical protein
VVRAFRLVFMIVLLAIGGSLVPTPPIGFAAASEVPVVITLDVPPLSQLAPTASPDERRARVQAITQAQDALEREIVALGGTVVARFQHAASGLAALLPPRGLRPARALPRVRTARAVGTYQRSANSATGAALPLPQQASGDGRGATLAVIDSGIDYTHSAFGGPGTPEAYAAALATNTTIGDNPFFPSARIKGGFDYVGEEWPSGPLTPDPDPLDAQGSGTALASIAAGAAPLGVAPAADLYAFKACSARTRECSGLALLQAIDDALDLDNDPLTRDPANVIVLAFSAPYGQPEDDLVGYVDSAAAAGALVVVAAGEGGDTPYIVGAPGIASGALSVGAVEATGAGAPVILASSARGPRINDGRIKPDMVARGRLIGAQVGSGTATTTLEGTGGAASLVAGAAALLYAARGPALSPAAYRALLMNSADPVVAALSGSVSLQEASLALEGRDGVRMKLRSRDRGLAPRLFVRCASGGGEVLDPTEDTYVDSREPARVFGPFSFLGVRDPSRGFGDAFALLRFPPPSCTASGAELQFEVQRIYRPGSGQLQLYGVGGGWNERTTWATRPPLGALLGETAVNGLGRVRVEVGAVLTSTGLELALRGAGGLSGFLVSRNAGAPPRVLVTCPDGSAQLIDPSEDTYAREDEPGSVFGAVNSVRVYDERNRRRLGLLRFAPPSCQPSDARLEFEAVSVESNSLGGGRRGGTIQAARAEGSWSEASTNWLNRPAVGAALGQVAITGVGRYALDLDGAFAAGSAVLAPITRQGAGELDIAAATRTQTLAWEERGRAGATPVYSQTASISFGYVAVDDAFRASRAVRVRNLSTTNRSYAASASFRYADDADQGVQLDVTPTSLTLAPNAEGLITLTLRVNAAGLRPWTLNAGALGNAGSNWGSPDTPSLTLFEYDGLLTIDGGVDNVVRLPWQVLPKRAANVEVDTAPREVAPGGSGSITLRNTSAAQAASVEVFALLERSPAIYSYTVGTNMGGNQSPSDLRYVGVRGRDAAGIPLVEFAATVYDAPFRAAQYPVSIGVLIDANRDGVDDYELFTADAGAAGSDGRMALFVRPLQPPAAPTQVGFADRDFNSQNWILGVPAATVGLMPSSPFGFEVRAVDNRFPPAPGTVVYDRSARLSYRLDTPAVRPAITTLNVPTNGEAALPFSVAPEGGAAEPGQVGLLLLYRQALVGREADALPINAPADPYPAP